MWDELIKTALLGTDRADLSIALLADLQALGMDIDEPPEKVLAKGLAYYRVLRKAAAELPLYGGEFPEPIETGDAMVCSPRSGRHLQLILDGTFESALSEFISLLKANKRSLPPESLPLLLDRCVKDRDLWINLQPAVGELGRWLIHQNPDWQVLSPRVDPGNWLKAGKDERLLILRHWRRTEPPAAVEALEKVWDSLDHAEKTAYLKTLQTGLSSADERLLEKCLNDGRKPVRQQAAELLTQLAGSKLQQRLFEAAAAMIRCENDRLDLVLPAELPQNLIRDGIEPESRRYTRSSLRLDWLLQLAERIPPRRWEESLDLEPEKMIALAAAADKTKNLVAALARAALQHKDEVWLATVARFWSQEQDEETWTSALGKEVLAGLSDEAANALAVRDLTRSENLIDEDSLAAQLLSLGVHDWEDRLALSVVKGFQNWLAGARTVHWNAWRHKKILSVAAYRCSPALIPKFQTGWPTSSRIWGLWEADVERFMRTLYFRREMREALEN